MRCMLLRVLRKYFCAQALHARTKMGMTQAQMAERLVMDERSYSDLEHGVSACSGLTLALFLIYCCDEPGEFLKELRRALEEEIEHAA